MLRQVELSYEASCRMGGAARKGMEAVGEATKIIHLLELPRAQMMRFILMKPRVTDRKEMEGQHMSFNSRC